MKSPVIFDLFVSILLALINLTMKTRKTIYLILGWFSLALGLLILLSIAGRAGSEETAYRVGYYLGSLISFLPAMIFFLLARSVSRKIKRRKTEEEMKHFLEELK